MRIATVWSCSHFFSDYKFTWDTVHLCSQHCYNPLREGDVFHINTLLHSQGLSYLIPIIFMMVLPQINIFFYLAILWGVGNMSLHITLLGQYVDNYLCLRYKLIPEKLLFCLWTYPPLTPDTYIHLRRKKEHIFFSYCPT